MDINKLKTRQKHEEGLEIQIVCPTSSEPLDFYITIVGPDSKTWRKLSKASIKKYLANKGKELTEEEQLQEDLLHLAEITIGWRGLTDDGKEVEFSKEACIELYSDAPYVMDQVDLAAGKFRNFIKG